MKLKAPDTRPFRAVVETKRAAGDAVLWVLECGHERNPKGGHFTGRARCNECPKEDAPHGHRDH